MNAFQILIILCAILVVWLAIHGRNNTQKEEAERKALRANRRIRDTEPPLPDIKPEDIRHMSRADIQSALKRLDDEPAPEERLGAMCYSRTDPPNLRDYICPLDGEKTVYSKGSNGYRKVSDTTKIRYWIRRFHQKIKGITFELDEKNSAQNARRNLKMRKRHFLLQSNTRMAKL